MAARDRDDEIIPPWLRVSGGVGGGGRGDGGRGGGSGAATWLRAVVLVAAGGVIGWFAHANREAVPGAAPPPVAAAEPPKCPPAPSCGDPKPATTAARPARAAAPKKHAATPVELTPLPSEEPPSEEKRRDLLRAFAEKKATELRACVADPNHGPQRRVGVALEIDARGNVAAVQILGADGTPPPVATCYAGRLRSWKFPTTMLDGPERLLVNFVL